MSHCNRMGDCQKTSGSCTIMNMKKSEVPKQSDNLGQILTAKTAWRKAIHWIPRWGVALLILIFATVTAVAGLSTIRPVYVPLPAPVYTVNRTAGIDYQVEVLSADGLTTSNSGENQIYLSDSAKAVHARFTYNLAATTSADLTWTSTVSGTLRVVDTADHNRILFEKKEILAPAVLESGHAAGFTVDRKVDVDLKAFKADAEALARQSRVSIRTELVISLDILAEAKLASGPLSINDQPELIVPLTADTFRISENLAALGSEKYWRWIQFQMIMAPIPFYWYPVVLVILLAGLILWLTLTKTRRKDKFEKQLVRMQRMAQGQLMLISDKAWEPEWCVTATDYRTMVKTARKLKHPVFCHVDRTGETPVAYFYVYYGENNYCLTFRPDSASEPVPSAFMPGHDFPAMPETGFGQDHRLEE